MCPVTPSQRSFLELTLELHRFRQRIHEIAASLPRDSDIESALEDRTTEGLLREVLEFFGQDVLEPLIELLRQSGSKAEKDLHRDLEAIHGALAAASQRQGLFDS